MTVSGHEKKIMIRRMSGAIKKNRKASEDFTQTLGTVTVLELVRQLVRTRGLVRWGMTGLRMNIMTVAKESGAMRGR